MKTNAIDKSRQSRSLLSHICQPTKMLKTLKKRFIIEPFLVYIVITNITNKFVKFIIEHYF